MVSGDQIASMLTVREVALLLHVHSNTVRRWSNRGTLKAYRITRRGDRRFKQSDIDRFLTESNVHNGNERKSSSI